MATRQELEGRAIAICEQVSDLIAEARDCADLAGLGLAITVSLQIAGFAARKAALHMSDEIQEARRMALEITDQDREVAEDPRA